MLRSQRTNILYHNHTLIFALTRSSVAETVPTRHVREVDYQLTTRVMRTILVTTIPLPLIQVYILLLCPRFDADRHFEGIRSQRPQSDLSLIFSLSDPHLPISFGTLADSGPGTNIYDWLPSWCNISFMDYLSGRFGRSGQVRIVWSDVFRQFLEWSVSFIRTES